MAIKKKLIAFSGPVKFTVVKAAEGETQGPPTFEVEAYTGVPMNIAGYDKPIVVDLAGMTFNKSLIANLDHVEDKRVGHVTEKSKDGTLLLKGIASAETPWRDEVVNNAQNGFPWQASIEAYPERLVEIEKGDTVEVNGRTFTGPLYVAKKCKLVGFAFVNHGADENTSVDIAARAASYKEKAMTTLEPKFQEWIEAALPGLDIENASPEVLASLKADYEGKSKAKRGKATPKLDDILSAKQAEIDRQEAITEIAAKACDSRPYDIDNIKILAQQAIEDKWSEKDFRLALFEASVPPAHTVATPRGGRLDNDVLEAAICMAGRLKDVEKRYPERVLEAADKRFKHGIGLKEIFVLAAEANGYRATGFNVSTEVHNAAMGLNGHRPIRAAADFSTLSLPNTFASVANKFLRMGWDAIDQTPLRIAAIRPVTDFKQITTISLTGGLLFEEVGKGGEIHHGTLGEETYNNQVKTRGIMFSITREDIINDDLGALTQIPRRMGRGGMLTLNDVFWTEFLDNSAFFTSGNANVNTGVADMTSGGLAATETIFMNQTDPDGNPMLTQPAIILVPTALKHAARTLMESELLIDGTGTAVQGNKNTWMGRFRVESSPYLSNSAYTGNSAVAWYMLADPNDIPVIEIAALNGRIEPTVETADADFNVLGVRMRGYSDIGVELQEPRGGVRADGGAS